MFDIKESALKGCYYIQPRIFKDHRGRFIKTFHQEVFQANGLQTDFAESYYSVSAKNVLRGLHFQTPPMAHAKLVYCLDGEILDAVVDLRRESATFGQFATFHLSGDNSGMVYLPEGFAHGFLVESERATVMYQVTSVYAPEQDRGIRWDSCGIAWPAARPIMSERDGQFPLLRDFESPF